MASTVWDPPAVEEAGLPSGLAAMPDSMGHRLRHMAALQGFVEHLVADGHQASGLTEEQWDELWSAAQGAESDAEAISRVIVQAYRLRERLVSTGNVGATVPRADIAAEPPVSGLDPGRMPSMVPSASTAVIDPVTPGWPLDVETEPLASPPVAPPTRRRRPSPPAGWRWIPTALLSLNPRTHLLHPKRLHARQGGLDDVHRERWLSFASWILHTGVIILLFVAWQLWGTAITQSHDQSALKKQFVTDVHHVALKPPSGLALIPATTRIADPPEGTVMAQVQIPKINLDQYVVSGTNEGDLAKGPGHYFGTAMPGQAGNVAIAGHRTTHGAPFNRLAELAIGDPIYLTTTSGQRLTYIVSAVPVAVSPTDVTVLNNFGDNRLTLTTCNPEFSARQRLIVVAAYLPPGARHPMPISTGTGTPYNLGPAARTGWDMGLVPLVVLEFAAIFALGLAYRWLSRVYGREGRFLILVPIWIGILYALFGTLTSFLPASV